MVSFGEKTAGRVSQVRALDRRVRRFLGTTGVAALRVSLGVVFVWFGLLKVLDVSPVAGPVSRTVYWFDPDVIVPLLGVLEIAVGSLLVLNRLVRVALAIFVGQVVGTFLVFLILPDVVFREGNPLLLTVEGEFVIKNLVLIAGGMVVGSRVRPIRATPRDNQPSSALLPETSELRGRS